MNPMMTSGTEILVIEIVVIEVVDFEILVNICHVAHFKNYIFANSNNEMFKKVAETVENHLELQKI